MPALNEAENLTRLLPRIPWRLVSQVIVVDNGSHDSTAAMAAAGGARVVHEPRRGYGRACQAGLAALRPEITAVAFMDADLSSDPDDLKRLLELFESGDWDLVLGSRTLGTAEPGSLTPLQQFGNWLATRLIRTIWKVRFTDLGPLRVIRRQTLDRLAMRDPDFGWNVEMQGKAASLNLRVAEIAVRAHRRAFGQSKISGTLQGSIRAGAKILWTIYRCWRFPTSSVHRV